MGKSVTTARFDSPRPTSPGAPNASAGDEEITRRVPSKGRQPTCEHDHRDDVLQLTLPRVGDRLFDFTLKGELGRGAFARVFLAQQNDLAGRLVVLKVSRIEGNEPQTLAQLQHTHIVPIHSVHESDGLGLRAVCMPYFGGTALSVVLAALWARHSPPTHGQQLVNALTESADPSRAPAGPQDHASPRHAGPRALDELRRLGHVHACVRIVRQLAEALDYAHQRGVVHCDIKPSNILLTSDGVPMLLDFNVSQSLLTPPSEAALGGTVAYMAPEHLQAFLDRLADRARPTAERSQRRRIDERSDIYSLGIVLYEMLVGARPFEATGTYSPIAEQLEAMVQERGRIPPSPRARRSDIPWSLESILRTCLHPDPTRRYASARDLAEDLRRFLNDQPLRVAPELSLRESIAKWTRRHPRLRSTGSVAVISLALLGVAGMSLASYRQHLRTTQVALDSAQAEQRRRAYEQGTVQALCYVNTHTELDAHAAQGRELCERTLAIYGVLDRDDWQDHPDWRSLDAESRRRLAEDTRELLQMLAWARVRGQPGRPETLRTALQLLDRADGIEGLPASRALEEDRAKYLEMLGAANEAQAARARAEAIPAVSARDFYMLATVHARQGKLTAAVAELTRALEINPRHFWAQLQRGICRQQLGQATLAAGDFGACIGLWPDFPWGYFNRAYSLEKNHHPQEAIADYTTALRLDPDFVPGHVNRAMVHLELRQYAEALADLERARALGRDDASLHLGIGVACEGLKQAARADEAFALALEKSKREPEEVRLRHQWVYGFAVHDRVPQMAGDAFDAVLARQPQHPQAQYGKVIVLLGRKQDTEARVLLDQVIRQHPTFVAPRRLRATLSARAGDFANATRDVNWCLEQPSDRGPNLYAAACVAALAAEKAKHPDMVRHATTQAIAFLQKAMEHTYAEVHFADDPDLAAVREHPQFRQWLRRRAEAK